jgi:hypothetical protein
MSPEPTMKNEPVRFQAPFSTAIHDKRTGGLIATGTFHSFLQKLSFAWYSFTSKLTRPELTTLRKRAMAGYPSSDVSPAMSGRLMNTTASTNVSNSTEMLTHS